MSVFFEKLAENWAILSSCAAIGMIIIVVHMYVKWKEKKYKALYGTVKGGSLIYHPVMATLVRYMGEAQTVEFISEYKTVVGRFMLNTHMAVGYERLHQLAYRATTTDMSHREACKTVQIITQKIVDDYTTLWVEEGVPDVLISRISHYHLQNIEKILHLAELEFAHSHKPVSDCMWNVFSLYQAVFTTAMVDFQVVINGANGSLKNCEFQGVTNVNADQHIDYDGVSTQFVDRAFA